MTFADLMSRGEIDALPVWVRQSFEEMDEVIAEMGLEGEAEISFLRGIIHTFAHDIDEKVRTCKCGCWNDYRAPGKRRH